MSEAIQENIVVDSVTSTIPEKKAKRARGGAGVKEKVKKEKIEKVKKVKEVKPIPVNKTWKIPSRNDTSWEQTKFLKHVHSLIKELVPQLLDMEDMRDAFNKVVECLSTFTSADFISFIPSATNRYKIYEPIVEYEIYSFLGNCGRICSCRENYASTKTKIQNEWLTFWNLIKPFILEHLEAKHFEKVHRQTIKKYQDAIHNLEDRAEQRITQIRETAENHKKWYIERVIELLKKDPKNKGDM